MDPIARNIKETHFGAEGGLDMKELEEINRCRLSVLGCVKCQEYTVPPIQLCVTGHNYCIKCRYKLTNCQLCHTDFLDEQHPPLDDFARKAKFPCRKNYLGCAAFNIQADLLLEHQKLCPNWEYTTSCPYAIIPRAKCNWEGGMRDIRRHIEIDHNVNIFVADKGFKSTVPFLGTDGYYSRVVTAMNELFLCLWTSKENFQYCCSVLYIGPDHYSLFYKYQLTMRAKNGSRAYSWLRRIRSVNEILTIMQNSERCGYNCPDMFCSDISCIHIPSFVYNEYFNCNTCLPFDVEFLKAMGQKAKNSDKLG